MHFFIAALLFVISLKWADWRHWRVYWPTMLFISLGCCLGSYLMGNKLLWTFRPDLPVSHKVVDLLYMLVICPLIAIMYLSRLPGTMIRKTVYYGIWCVTFCLIEWFMSVTGRISYHFGWSIWWSILFYFVMFLVITLHQTKTWIAYVLSLLMSVFLMVVFEIPLK